MKIDDDADKWAPGTSWFMRHRMMLLLSSCFALIFVLLTLGRWWFGI